MNETRNPIDRVDAYCRKFGRRQVLLLRCKDFRETADDEGRGPLLHCCGSCHSDLDEATDAGALKLADHLPRRIIRGVECVAFVCCHVEPDLGGYCRWKPAAETAAERLLARISHDHTTDPVDQPRAGGGIPFPGG